MTHGSKGNRSFITHLECSSCSAIHDHRVVQNVCTKCGKALLARYDLGRAKRGLDRDVFSKGPASLWRYRALLPVEDDAAVVSLGEGWTPILPLKKIGREFSLPELFIKDESYNATGSFKARGLCLAVSKALELGITETCIPTAGNAGGALAAYAAAAGLTAHVFMPEDTPRVNIDECRLYGADVHLVKGLISDAAREMNAHPSRSSWFDTSTLKEPYRLEGKKTLGYEIAEQWNWKLPDVIVYPTGGGTGLIGMWKAFVEMTELGWIQGPLPRMISVQSSGCAPIVKAFESGSTVSDVWGNAETIASGLRVPKAFADTLILNALYDSRGCALAVDDNEIMATMRHVAEREGVMLSPEGAATLAALPALLSLGIVDDSTRVLLYNTGTGLKYGEVLQRTGAQ